MGNCLPLIGGHSTPVSTTPPSVPNSYTNPLALPHNSSYVNNLYERNRSNLPNESDQMSQEQSNRVRSLLAQIPAMGYRAEMGEAECAICMGELDAGERVRYLPCMHLFHVECVDDWLVRSFNCPSCLEPVDSTMLSSFTAHNTLKLSEIASSSASN
ncbi:hypothetical protein PFISCL1PPCAC_28724 [Pristionchus fissidentatus]|uniref:RING-type domain-containing protein n=1 Tax=Pristionchus fissidentatus TaxID=1538716 RepID=A0AAV5X1Z0_9BILA|nr:hypothetical protein PFISCL1PPCAC_6040 [Pristionchus fissidentatus]GMT37427.1 hypothetical protein PFISCL1PPCAC_28724 [Pristionchus fissidentatus]